VKHDLGLSIKSDGTADGTSLVLDVADASSDHTHLVTG